MKARTFISLLSILLCIYLTGCIRQVPNLVGTPTPVATPSPPPTPTPEIVELPADLDLDALGNRIDSQSHYEQYLFLRDVRIYEYEGDTMLDGVFYSEYPEKLTGKYEIIFYDKTGEEVARALIYCAGVNADNVFLPGKTNAYAQINTDIDIQLLPFELSVVENIWPEISL